MKHRGKITLTFELLGELLGLENGEEISSINVSDNETLSIIVSSPIESSNTECISEGATIPEVPYKRVYINNNDTGLDQDDVAEGIKNVLEREKAELEQ